MLPTENQNLEPTDASDDEIDRQDELQYANLFFPGSAASMDGQELAEEEQLAAAKRLTEEQIRATRNS
ncbi:MAG: hypothetical protein WCT53_04950 [Candidatus Gracilibacteria bacterium]|jgi:hypothetical protein